MDIFKRKEIDMSDNESCKNCKFFMRHPEWYKALLTKNALANGECRRYPPVTRVNEDGDEDIIQQNTYDDDWCGEWK
jgi:hypothetical protein